MPAVYKKRGYREFLNLAIRLCRFTEKWQANIKAEGPAQTDALVDSLLNILLLLISLRQPGPN